MLDMSKFWSSIKEATDELGGDSFTEHAPLCGGGQRRWPNWARSATIHNTPGGDVRLHRVDCYGWCRVTD